MANKFKHGDVVVLKSGGPPMTVDRVPGDTDISGHKQEGYRCRWFKGASSEQHVFSEHTLEIYVPLKK